MGHATIEWVYIGIVISLLTWVGVEAWNVERQIEHVPTNAETIKVIGQQWFWTFEHEDGNKETGELHIKQNVPYKFELVSKDVVHSFNIPDFVVLMDAVPGRVNVVWNMFDKPGEYRIQCREYCGFGHPDMKAKLFIEPFTQPAEAAPEKPTPQVEDANVSAGVVPPSDIPGGTSLTILEGSSVQGSPAYDPDPINVKKGDKIIVTNKDTVPHTVTDGTGPTDPNSAKQFDTSILEGGASAEIQTDILNPGEIPYYCTVHPYMIGKLVVE